MTDRRPSPPADQMARADALLETCRPLPALPPGAHTRVKRRLAVSLAGRSGRGVRWLGPVVIAGALLLCGAAFGIALDRMVLGRSSSATNQAVTAAGPAGRRLRPGRTGRHVDSLLVAPAPPSVSEIADLGAEGAKVPPLLLAPVTGEGRPMATPARAPGRRLALPSPRAFEAEAHPLVPAQPPGPEALPKVGPSPQAAPALLLAPATAGDSAPPTPTPLPPPPSTDGLSEERLLAAAVRALRSQNDAHSALAALDEYRTHYPQGRLSVEANALRADALIALHRPSEALGTLDGLDLARVPGGLERQLQRGELRASAGRRQEAIADFDAVLARLGQGDLAERALWGRAQSKLLAGDRAGAREDAALYLRRYPSGRFAAAAARMAEVSP
jgi:hypothetical protein